MHAEAAQNETTQQLQIPQDLVSALKGSKKGTDYSIESLKPSFFGRLVEKIMGPRN